MKSEPAQKHHHSISIGGNTASGDAFPFGILRNEEGFTPELDSNHKPLVGNVNL